MDETTLLEIYRESIKNSFIYISNYRRLAKKYDDLNVQGNSLELEFIKEKIYQISFDFYKEFSKSNEVLKGILDSLADSSVKRKVSFNLVNLVNDEERLKCLLCNFVESEHFGK